MRFVLGGMQLTLSSHGFAIVAGVAAGAALAARRAREPLLVVAIGSVVAAVALVGSHALFVALYGGRVGRWSGGLSSTGGVLASLAATWIIAKAVRRPALELLDALAPAALLALAIGRVGCFLAGCCYGRPTTLPWGVVFPELGPPMRHPLQLYSAAADLALVALLPAHAPTGTVIRRACLGFGLVRAALETLRDPAAADLLPGGWLTLPQGVALALAAAAFVAPLGLRQPDSSNMAPPRRKRAHGR